jgi:hypothetical protein
MEKMGMGWTCDETIKISYGTANESASGKFCPELLKCHGFSNARSHSAKAESQLASRLNEIETFV